MLLKNSSCDILQDFQVPDNHDASFRNGKMFDRRNNLIGNPSEDATSSNMGKLENHNFTSNGFQNSFSSFYENNHNSHDLFPSTSGNISQNAWVSDNDIDRVQGEYKVFRLPKTLFIQVFVFIYPGVCFCCTANREPGQ